MPTIDAIIQEIPKPRVAATKYRYGYTVHIDGELLHTHQEPIYTTCRILQKRGIAGELRFWRRKADGTLKPHPDFIVRDISKCAKLTVAENMQAGPRLKRFVPQSQELTAQLKAVGESGSRRS